MLENIKSSFFMKIIFFHIEERRKLNLVRHNKSIQKILDIAMINYKLLSGKYIIFENKRFGREYESYQNQLIYEGGYFRGEKKVKEQNFLIFIN